MCRWPLTATRVAKRVSDQGNQHNNGPHQDQIFDNPSGHCLALWAKNQIGLQWGLMHPIGSLRREYDFLFLHLKNKLNKKSHLIYSVQGLHDLNIMPQQLIIIIIIIIIMYIYHVLINALSAHMIHINLNMIFYTHVKHSPTKTIYIKYYFKKH